MGLGGISFAEQANGPNFGSLFIMLEPFDQRRNKDLRADAIMAKLRKAYAKQVKDARVVVFGSAPIPGLSTAGGFKVMIEDRGGLGLPILQDQTDKLIRSVQSSQLGLAGVSDAVPVQHAAALHGN